jgi:hypothetical protein
MVFRGSLGVVDVGRAENAVEAGITEVWNPLVSGRLKVMASLTNWFRESRKYHRDDKDRQAGRPPDGRDEVPDRSAGAPA